MIKPTHQINTSVIPEALKQQPQWICWKLTDIDGKPTKYPIDAKTGGPAKSNDSDTWTTFEIALSRASAYDGISFCFTVDDTFCGIDLDDCIDDNGVIVPEAQAIIDQFNSYAEISPSGHGVKIFIEAKKSDTAKSRSKAVEGFKEIEVYDTRRFFTVTGRHLDGTPLTVESRQLELDDLCRRLWPPKPSSPPRRVNGNGFNGDDQQLLDLAMQSKGGDAFRRLYNGDISMHGDDHSAADLALCNKLAFWTSRDPARMDRLFRGSGLYREKWEREDYRSETINKAIEDCTDVYTPSRNSQSTPAPTRDPSESSSAPCQVKPNILIDTQEHRVVDETVQALSIDPDIFQRGTMLVRVIREAHADGIVRSDGSAIITPLPPANLRERMTRCATFTKINRKGEEIAAHPAQWLVSAVHDRGEWPGIRRLVGVSDAPILRADGSIWQTPGYDEQTGVLYEPAIGMAFPKIPDDVGIDDAQAAVESLKEVVCDFRFESDDHLAAWFSGLLTPLARFAFDGPSPLFLIDANVRGAGKGLLAQTIGRIVLGREMPVFSYSHDSDEMRKKITALAISGDRMILLDNLEGNFGNDALDRALTSTRWKDRVLGKSEQVELPLLPVWYGTGNNVAVAADTTRRIIHIRLDVLEEHPEDRTDFTHPDLIGWITKHRMRLLADALTILSAYLKTGTPAKDLTPFGSFEGWSSVVRQAVYWAMQIDPCATRIRLVETSDRTADALGQLVDAWRAYDPTNTGLVIASVLSDLYPQTGFQPRDDASVAMRAALENLIGCPPGKTPTPRQVGNKLRLYRRRVIGGEFLDVDPNAGRRSGAVWKRFGSSPSTTCESGESRESFSTPTREKQQ